MKTNNNQKLKIMKKLKVFVAFGALCFLMSSCVYSLFPIYTQDTLVYLPELVGKWMMNPNESNNYIEFIPMAESDEEELDAPEPVEIYTDSIVAGDLTVRYNSADGMMVNGKLVYDKDSIKAFYEKILTPNKEKKPKSDKAFEALEDVAQKAIDASSKFEGAAYITREESYKMVVMEGDERLVYQAHVAKIGADLFLDLYPLPEYSDEMFGTNLFPVHTFMKLSLTDGNLELTQFDLEKLNKLFESNLVRLRHEMVDGTVLITAKPEEIQKFLDKYSNDELVFEGKEVYTKTEE
jgi:hypothetical protein